MDASMFWLFLEATSRRRRRWEGERSTAMGAFCAAELGGSSSIAKPLHPDMGRI